ncbi:major facilitator superfamily domain-containing protein [Clohesyomyces aquaticus]|uniref:Major facilitator superfamily domain-containing protein n=1 Tax=Clohesyomyces aquaticus TaxID=1231657 RepID=A0A1Y2A4T6_9PLEO|nr:major facilitator superfamily domain-containing protein [Clohesyomyces aquaticus]
MPWPAISFFNSHLVPPLKCASGKPSTTPQNPSKMQRRQTCHRVESSASVIPPVIVIEPAVERERVSAPRPQPRPTLPGPLPSAAPSATPSEKWTRGPGFWRSFVSICIPLLLSALEGSVTNTALPTISDALDLGTKFSWVATAFLLASTILQPLYGQLADIWGRRYPMMLSVIIFAIGSAICGWATNGAMMISGRIIQGLGTGGIDLFAELILCDLVPLRKRGTYMAIKHVVFAAGTTIGPLLGGVFAEHNWRWCFWINLPVCGIAVVLMFFWLKVGGGVKTKEAGVLTQLHRIDRLGTSLLTSSVILILLSLSTGGAPQPWSSAAVLWPLIVGLVGLATFPFFEASKYCVSPIMPPSVFNNRTSACAFGLTAIHGFITYGIQFFLPPFFQAIQGSTPSKSGIQVLPTTLVIVVLAAIGGPLLTCFGKYRPMHQIGFGLMTLGAGLCTLFCKDTNMGVWIVVQLIVAAGSGIIVSTLLPAILVELPDKANGAAAGSWAFLRGTGSLFGVALPSAIFNFRFAALLSSISSPDARSQLSSGQAYQRASSEFVSKFGEKVKWEIVNVFTQMVSAVGFAITWGEKQVKLRKELDTEFGLKKKRAVGVGMDVEKPGAVEEVTAENASEDVISDHLV